MQIAMIGLGLIGGSILRSLKSFGYELVGVSRRQETIDTALNEGLISCGGTDINVVRNADIVFVCTPITKTVSTIEKVAKVAKPEAIITDAASIKASIMDYVNAYSTPIRFIGGHPMAGTENKGLDASFEGLYKGAKWVLTPSKWSTGEDIKQLREIIEKLGAEPVIAAPDEHDKAVALISHMPLLLSQSLYSLIKNYPDENIGQLAMKLAASGFRDMTRLAAGNAELSKDMLFENKKAVLSAFSEFLKEASSMSNQLAGTEDSFGEVAGELAVSRKEMYSPEGKNLI